MFLDTTNLNSADTKRLNGVADELRYEYIDQVSKLVILRQDDTPVYSHPFFAKNSAVCPVFESVVWYFFVKEKIASDKVSTLIVDAKHWSLALSKLADENAIKTCIKNKKLLRPFVRPFVNLCKLSGWWLYERLAFKLSCSGMRLSDMQIGGRPVKKVPARNVIVETIFYKTSCDMNGRLHDRHFSNTVMILKKTYGHNVVVFPFLYGFFNYSRLFRCLRKHRLHVVSLAELIKFRYFFSGLKDTIFFQLPQFDFCIREVAFTDVAMSSIKINRWKVSSIIARLKYSSLVKLAPDHGLTEKFDVLRWHEGHELDCMSMLGWRESNLLGKAVGYYDAFPPKNYLCPYINVAHKAGGVVPDRMFVVSRILQSELDLSRRKTLLGYASSLRFKNIKAKENSEERSKSDIFVIALPLLEAQSIFIIKLIERALVGNRLADYKIILRPHPASGYRLNLKHSNVVIDNTSPFMHILSKSSGLVGAGSSTVMEAIANGVSVGIVNFPSSLSALPTPKDIAGSCCFDIYNSDDLVEFFTENSRNKKLKIELGFDRAGVSEPAHHFNLAFGMAEI